MGAPRIVQGVVVTCGLRRSRFALPLRGSVRKNRRSPTWYAPTGVGTGVPSRLNVVRSMYLRPSSSVNGFGEICVTVISCLLDRLLSHHDVAGQEVNPGGPPHPGFRVPHGTLGYQVRIERLPRGTRLGRRKS